MKRIFMSVIILFILTLTTFLIASLIFNMEINREVDELFSTKSSQESKTITEEMIKKVPVSVQQYLKQAGVIGKERVRSVRLKQKGFIKTAPDQEWIPFEAEQYYTTGRPGFIWTASAKAAPFITIRVRDKFYKGKGNVYVKLMSLITIGDDTGPEIDQGTLIRFFDEMVWFPTAFLEDYISWEKIDSHSVKATIGSDNLEASAILNFNKKGELINFTADRYMFSDGRGSKEKWSTPMGNYKIMDGLRIPTEGKAIWHLTSGDFCYVKLTITDIEYNIPEPY